MSEVLPDNPDDFDPRFRDKADENLLVRFYYEPRPSKTKKHADGRSLIEEVEYMKEKYNIEYVYLTSETFLASSEERFMKFIKLWKERINLSFWAQTGLKTVNKDKSRNNGIQTK